MAPAAVKPCPILADLMKEVQDELDEGMVNASDLITLPLVAYEELLSEQWVWHCTCPTLTKLTAPATD